MEMLSTHAKLDKLNILNQTRDAFLSSRDAKLLREVRIFHSMFKQQIHIQKIPCLDKPIWFSATCYRYQKGFKYKENDYEIEGEDLYREILLSVEAQLCNIYYHF